MLDWIVERSYCDRVVCTGAIRAAGFQHFTLIRSMFALLLIVLVLLILALRPLRSFRRYLSSRQSADHGVDR